MNDRQLLSEAETHLTVAAELLRQVQRGLLSESAEGTSHSVGPVAFKLAYSISEVQKMVGLGRTTIFKMIKEGRLKAVKEGDRTLVLASELSRWVSSISR